MTKEVQEVQRRQEGHHSKRHRSSRHARRRWGRRLQMFSTCGSGLVLFAAAVFRGIPDKDRFATAEMGVAWALAVLGCGTAYFAFKSANTKGRIAVTVAVALIVVGIVTLMYGTPHYEPPPGGQE